MFTVLATSLLPKSVVGASYNDMVLREARVLATAVHRRRPPVSKTVGSTSLVFSHTATEPIILGVSLSLRFPITTLQGMPVSFSKSRSYPSTGENCLRRGSAAF
nr:hypothetical protein [Tanacetum cinerariifolium]